MFEYQISVRWRVSTLVWTWWNWIGQDLTSSNTDSFHFTLFWISVTGKLTDRRCRRARSRSPWSASHPMSSMTLTLGMRGLAVMSACQGGTAGAGWGQEQGPGGGGGGAFCDPWLASQGTAEQWRTSEECSSETKRVLSISLRGMLEKFYCCICCGICINT